MKLELRDIRRSEKDSGETHAYEADLYAEHILVAHVSNDGNGGSENVDWLEDKKEEWEPKVHDFVASLPPVHVSKDKTVPMDLDTWCQEFVENFVNLSDFKKRIRESVCIWYDGKFNAMKMSPDMLRPPEGRMRRVQIQERFPGAIVINDLPVDVGYLYWLGEPPETPPQTEADEPPLAEKPRAADKPKAGKKPATEKTVVADKPKEDKPAVDRNMRLKDRLRAAGVKPVTHPQRKIVAEMVCRPEGASTKELARAAKCDGHAIGNHIYYLKHTHGYEITPGKGPNAITGAEEKKYFGTAPAAVEQDVEEVMTEQTVGEETARGIVMEDTAQEAADAEDAARSTEGEAGGGEAGGPGDTGPGDEDRGPDGGEGPAEEPAAEGDSAEGEVGAEPVVEEVVAEEGYSEDGDEDAETSAAADEVARAAAGIQ